ncbi:hypothetical protein SNOG_03244 [Parastagonospora nodorum SN15]|uniref:Alpha-ketoglutarate-dependent dioxygenase AlkB-like domain-containing protein n=1 Tax=Phaeosphaeria nodorum (strain SN15 / ATCC MYA-4574 / FGSC 10173) TaxID=321614 RepID=Q0UYC0_PHANO|nr:hypothetical protein SNOG_03244 [Parastagonospora nodorum SN15]EAT89975.2 hypothetical protein SNOG_03244 [Parastagonospora nodorum SN15]
METPSSLKAHDSSDTPGTTFSTIFDSDNSPLSSPSSSALSHVYNDPHHDKSSRNTQALALFEDPKNCETAASQRPRRGTKSLLPLNEQIEEISEPVVEQISATAQDVAQPAIATEEVDERPTPASFAAESAFADNKQSSPATPAAARQLRKRKTNEAVKEDLRTPSPKKIKTIAVDAPSKSKTKSKSTPRRSARTRTKSKKQTLLEATLVEDSPDMSSLVIALRISPLWFSPGGPLERLTVSQYPDSHTQENVSFDSMTDRPAIHDENQYAQPLWAPVPASSQTASTDGSSFLRTQPHQSQKFVSQEPSTITSRGTIPTPPYNRNGDSNPMGLLSDLIDATQSRKRAIVDEHSELYKISERLFANRKPGLKKPAPSGNPEVWAAGRQELCETLHYYRSYQSGCYANGGFARGFMFDKIAHARDYIDNDVVISRAGGGLVKDTDSGQMKSGKDQADQGPVVTALKNCITHCNPVVLITGADNPHMPSQPPHQYCVLDYFKPTHIWVEKSNNNKIVRYRFEKLNTEKKSWWSPENEDSQVELGSLDPPIQETCDSCCELSMQVYLNGWMCLQPNCSAFWHIIQESGSGSYKISREPDEAELIYDPRFLKQKTPWLNDNMEYSLKFDRPEISDYALPGESTSQSFSSGIVCPDCAHGYRINRYQIPGLDGFITHMVANKIVVEEDGGPSTMFEELQKTDIGLRRRIMPNGQLKGDTYCRHFNVNYGMPYKFIAATDSHPFEGAARPINATRSRLIWATKLLAAQETARQRIAPNSTNYHALFAQQTEKIMQEPTHPLEFNEVLALGYFESQKINYHDDGEFGLGPTIATLSLGAPGTMRIRMKARHYHGVSSAAGLYDEAPPIPGCSQYEARLALQPELDALKLSDPKAYRARLKEVPKQLALKHSGNAKDVLKMELGHGDIVVMHGADVQKYYEHSVEHAGKLRFALTCRYIDPESLKEADKPGYEVGPDLLGYDGAKLC